MRWGTEVWDRFEEVSNYVQKGIEFYEKYEEFWKKRCSIENTYARSLRKLIESYEPKKKEIEENNSTHLKCFSTMLSELRDVAGQHELISENVQDSVLSKLNQFVKCLKEERRKCIEDKDRFYTEHLAYDEVLEKCKQKYERSFREVEKAEDLLVKVENDDSASKNDIKKQKNVCELKKRQFDGLEAEYAKQLCEANRVKNAYYYEKLPSVFDILQSIEKKRVENFKDVVNETVNVEIEVLPRIKQCLDEIESSAQRINSAQDTEIVVKLFKTGYQVPADHVFEDLKQLAKDHLNSSLNNSNGTGTLNSTASLNSNNQAVANRQKKYRTLSRIKGLFVAQAGKVDQDSNLFELPPQQLKNELLKKMNALQAEIDKQTKEREGLNKLKEIYSKNQKFGDSQSAELALKSNEEKLSSLYSHLKKYQEIYNQVELNQTATLNSTSNNGNGNNNSTLHQQAHYFECSSNGSGSSDSNSGMHMGNGNGADSLKRAGEEEKHVQHIYQSPSENSINKSANGLANGNGQHGTTSFSSITPATCTTLAYTVSSSSSSMPTSKLAPLVNSNNNESFDDEDDDVEEDDGCYEVVNRKMQTSLNLNSQTDKIIQNNPEAVDSVIGTALVIYAFEGNVQNAISIQENESLSVLERDSGDGWTLVRKLNGEKGYVPTDYIRIVYY